MCRIRLRPFYSYRYATDSDDHPNPHHHQYRDANPNFDHHARGQRLLPVPSPCLRRTAGERSMPGRAKHAVRSGLRGGVRGGRELRHVHADTDRNSDGDDHANLYYDADSDGHGNDHADRDSYGDDHADSNDYPDVHHDAHSDEYTDRHGNHHRHTNADFASDGLMLSGGQRLSRVRSAGDARGRRSGAM